MRIAVNTRFLLKDKLEGIGWFTYEILQRITRNHPEHEFVLLFDRPFDQRFIFGENVQGKTIPPPARHPILWKLWYELSVPRALCKMEADIFISPDGHCSLKTKVPTLMVVHDLAFEHFPGHVPKNVLKYYQKYTPRYAHKSQRLITVSEFSKNDISKLYKVDPKKIDVVPNAVSDAFQPLTALEKGQVKKDYAGGEDYFLFVSALQPRKNVGRLLLAFDQFKKNHPCTVKLLVVGSHTWIQKEIEQAIQSTACKEDIIFTGHMNQAELARVMGAALALCYISLFEGFGIPILEAMRADVPVITSNTSSMPEVAGDAALLVDPYAPEAIARAMADVYAQPGLREVLIEKGREQGKKFSWDRSAKKFWDVVERMMATL